MFTWRACMNILHVGVELFRHHIIFSPLCVSCSKEMESLVHVFTECRGLRDIWSGPPFNLPAFASHSSFWAILQLLKKPLSRVLFLQALIICWKAWETRNKEVHGAEMGWRQDLVHWSKTYLDSYHAAQVPSSLNSDSRSSLQVWIPPTANRIKINVDAALPSNSENFRVSMVARNAQGVTQWWSRKEMVGRPNPTEAEALAVLHGLEVARQHGWSVIIVETDCLPVHRYLMAESRSLISFGAMLDSCLSFHALFSFLSFSFVKRSSNSVAHAIATSSHLFYNEGAFIPSSLIY